MANAVPEFYTERMVPYEVLRTLPKVELHDHLDGGLRPATVIALAREAGVALPASSPETLAAWFLRGADRKSLALYLEGFALTVAVMQTREALERVAYEAAVDVAADGAVYAEFRFAPILHAEKGLNLEAVLESVLAGLERGSAETGLGFGLILCALRDRDGTQALEAAELAVAYRDRRVFAFDVAGDELGHPPKRLLEAFQYARGKNFNVTIHAGEAFGVESIWQAIQICGAHRIGHGTRLIEDMVTDGNRIIRMGSLARYVKDHRIPLECCISSNLQTGAAPSVAGHPFGLYYRNGFRTTLCVDNRLMSGTSLSREYALAGEAFGLELEDLEKLAVNAMKSAFAPFEERVRTIYERIKPPYALARADRDDATLTKKKVPRGKE